MVIPSIGAPSVGWGMGVGVPGAGTLTILRSQTFSVGKL